MKLREVKSGKYLTKGGESTPFYRSTSPIHLLKIALKLKYDLHTYN